MAVRCFGRLQIPGVLWITAGGVAMGAAATGSASPPVIRWLGFLPGGAVSNGVAVNANGTVVAGFGTANPPNPARTRAWRWSANPTPPNPNLENLGVLTGGRESRGVAVSLDGTTVTGWSNITGGLSRGFRWTGASGMQELAILAGGHTAKAMGASDDGSVIAGMADTDTGESRAVIWTGAAPGAISSKGTLAGDNTSEFWGISGDGLTAVGYSRPAGGGPAMATRWTGSSGLVPLGRLAGATNSFAYAASRNGSRIVGWSDPGSLQHAVLWTPAPSMHDLGMLSGATSALAYTVSGDGEVVGGATSVGALVYATIWTPDANSPTGWAAADLTTLLSSLGADMTGWGVLDTVYGMSSDGASLTGHGVYQGQFGAFLVTGLSRCGTTIDLQPSAAIVCPEGLATFSVHAAGGGPFSYQWQIEPSANVWVDLGNDPLPLPCGHTIGFGASTSTLHLGVSGCTGGGTAGGYRVRCIVAGACPATSDPAMLTLCPADFNCDGFIDFFDAGAFIDAFEAGDPSADFNGDGFLDFFDADSFVEAFELGC